MRQVLLSDQAKTFLRRLEPKVRRRLKATLDEFAQAGGKGNSLDVKALDVPAGTPPIKRIAVGSWRIAVHVDAKTIRVLRIFHRSQGYTWLDP